MLETSATGNGTIRGQITGPGGLVVGAGTANGSGTLVIGGDIANDYAGDTLINNDATLGGAKPNASNTLQIAATRNNVMPHGVGKGNVILNAISGTITATFDLNGTSQTINGLASTAASASTNFVHNSLAGTTSTLTVGDGNATANFGGIL